MENYPKDRGWQPAVSRLYTAQALYKNALYKNLRGSVPFQGFAIWGSLGFNLSEFDPTLRLYIYIYIYIYMH